VRVFLKLFLAAGKYCNDFIIIYTPNAHTLTLKDADGERHLSLTLTGFVVCWLPTGEKESK